MAEFELTVADGSGLNAGTSAVMYRNAANRIVAPAGLTIVGGTADNRSFDPAPGDTANGLDVDVTRLPADVGLIGDGVVAAGATGSISAKLRRISTDIATAIASLATMAAGIAGGRYQVDIVSGGLTITRPGTWTTTTPSVSAADSALIVGNVNRLGLFVRNRSDVSMFIVGGGVAATLTNTPINIDAGATWRDESGYTGTYRAILEAGGTTANMVVAELTA